MDYKVVVTPDAEHDLEEYVGYLLFEKKNDQAARNLLDDFEITKKILQNVAGSLKYCENPKLKEQGYKRINFTAHRYFMLYRISGNLVIIDNIFHELQDYENRMN
ncbi:MAG TPA: type II toxin-antitoxin system RelE/ParE family toxin [Candidatus Mediterraneibacter excrementigallinarum]|nr:type II toxin-antitoxin system RelE/ParE family toxin [Candidatus Mediterraneibacter excrementigallinarum]HJD46646.1 type II toxin-antitoxin system RelE/ParE family toxin [Candidatus Mediterraneibacter norfolkensis]